MAFLSAPMARNLGAKTCGFLLERVQKGAIKCKKGAIWCDFFFLFFELLNHVVRDGRGFLVVLPKDYMPFSAERTRRLGVVLGLPPLLSVRGDRLGPDELPLLYCTTHCSRVRWREGGLE